MNFQRKNSILLQKACQPTMKHYVCIIDQDMGLSTFAKLRTYPDGKIMTKIIGMGPQK